jgi:hypothetical protein
MKSGKGVFIRVTILLMVVKLGLHMLSSTVYELHRDEMLYFNMAAHPAFGYVSVPPLTGWLAAIVKAVFGFSVFGLRLVPALFGTASIWVISKIVSKMGGGWRAMLIAGISFILAPGFLLFHSLFTPNAAEMFFWLCISWQFIRLISENDPRRWMLIGFLSGLSFLNKYSVGVYVLCIVVALLFSRCRHLFLSRYLLYALGIGLFLICPNIYWQYQHNWPVITHMQALQDTQLSSRHYGDFFSEVYSLLFFSTLVAVTGLAFLFYAVQGINFRWMGVSVILVFLFFLVSHGKGYYLLGMVPLLLATGGVAAEKWLVNKNPMVLATAMTIFICCSLAAMPYGLPMLSFDRLHAYTRFHKGRIPYPFAKWEDGEPHTVSQVYADMTGWKELTSLVERAYRQLPDSAQQQTTIYCQRNYGYAGAIYFYGRPAGLPEPVTFLESYVLWAPDSIPEGPVVYIHRELGDMQSLFRRIDEIGVVRDPWFRESGIRVYLCRDPLPGMREAYATEAWKEKEPFAMKNNKGGINP